MSLERPVVVRGRDGVPLFAMLHEPERPRSPRVGVSLLNPGLKNRVAPNRLNVRLARRLAREGYFVLRLDPPGIGDSGGDLPELALPELWQRIQRGALVDPVVEAHRVFPEACDLAEVVGIGNCGGAITALLACAHDPASRRLILIDLPVTVRGDDPDPNRVIRGRGHGAWVLAAYFRRLGDWRAWVRFVTFRSDMGTIGRALRARFFGSSPARAGAGPQTGSPAGAGGEDEHLNEVFLDAFKTFEARSGRALFVTAEQDNNTILFDTMFADRYLARPERDERHRRITIKDANHIYGLPEWRDALIGSVVDWMEATGGTTSPEIARTASVAKGEMP